MAKRKSKEWKDKIRGSLRIENRRTEMIPTIRLLMVSGCNMKDMAGVLDVERKTIKNIVKRNNIFFKDFTKPNNYIGGQTFGRLFVTHRYNYKNKSDQLQYLCKCSCGKELYVTASHLISGHTKSCGCLFIEKQRNSKLGIKKDREGFYGYKDSLMSLKLNVYKKYRCGAESRELDFELTLEQFLGFIFQECFYCGCNNSNKIISRYNSEVFLQYNGIDRIDNNKGYIVGNCVPCCKFCNFSKRTLTQQEFYSKIKQIYHNLNNKGLV